MLQNVVVRPLATWVSGALVCLGACGGSPRPPVAGKPAGSARATAASATAQADPLRSDDELRRLTFSELELEAALPLARHGRVFRIPWLDAYFRQQPWYRATGFDPAQLTPGERARIAAIRRVQTSFTENEIRERRMALAMAAMRTESPLGRPWDRKAVEVEQYLLSRALPKPSNDDNESVRPMAFTRPELVQQPLDEAELQHYAEREGGELNHVRALIYARHGRVFRSPRWSYSQGKPDWYHPDPNYTDGSLTELDRENLARVKRVEDRISPRRPRGPADPASLVATSAFPGCPAGAVLHQAKDPRFIVTYACERPGRGPKAPPISHGPTWRWLPTGRLRETRSYDNGKEHGAFVTWYWTGARREDGEFVHGVRQGRRRLFHVTGAVEDDATYDAGKLVGARHRAFDTGKPSLEATYEHGKPDGAFTTFYDGGRPALHATFRDGELVKSESFLPDGAPWPHDTQPPPCDYDEGCKSPFAQLDLESLPPLPRAACREGNVGITPAWPKSVQAPLLTAARKAWGDVQFWPPTACTDQIRLTCAPDLDGVAGGEMLAVFSYRIPWGTDLAHPCGGRAGDGYSRMEANVILSPPAPGRPNWTQHGYVGYPVYGADNGGEETTVRDYVRLPDGEAAILTDTSFEDSGSGCVATGVAVYGSRKGSWQALARHNRLPCGEFSEPEEFDPY